MVGREVRGENGGGVGRRRLVRGRDRRDIMRVGGCGAGEEGNGRRKREAGGAAAALCGKLPSSNRLSHDSMQSSHGCTRGSGSHGR